MPETKKRGRPKKGFLPGLAPELIQAVEDAADVYYDAMLERCKLSKEEDDAQLNLQAVMEEHRLTKYVTADGLECDVIIGKKKVKVKKKGEPSENGEESSE
jgi:hypothetical protein